MTETFTVVTANLQHGRAARELGGLSPLAGVDAALFQEVKMPRDEFAARLNEDTGMTLGHFDEEFGLAIGIDPTHTIREQHREVIKEIGRIGRLVLSSGLLGDSSFRFRPRGILGITVETPDENLLTLATTHPAVQMLNIARNRQIRRMPGAVSNMPRPVIFVGDMNHIRGPRRTDRQMYRNAGLSPVDLADAPTFDFSRTRYPIVGKVTGLKPKFDVVLHTRDGLTPIDTEIIDIPSDHRAVRATFKLGE